MPLPAALAARLAKRGIVSTPPTPPAPKKASVNDQVEEVFAEDYDEHPPEQPKKVRDDGGSDSEDDDREIIHDSIACPNKSNPYHQCVAFCHEKWGAHEFEPKVSMKRKKDRMLKKYPLPEGWVEVGDPETNRYYYWNTETDEVSWLSPKHPRAKVSLSADVLKRSTQRLGGQLGGSEESESESDEDEEKEMDLDMDDEDFEKLEREIMREKQENEERRQSSRGGRRGREKIKEELDPMDPASYSDIPRGSWSDGLERTGAKTGADVTASGPLFQQRPYPSPGAVLRMNKDK